MAHGDKQRRAEAHHFSYVNHWRDTVGILLHSMCVCVRSEQVLLISYIQLISLFLLNNKEVFAKKKDLIRQEKGLFV